MAATYGFFNSLNGDRTYNADQMSEYFDGLVSNGVYEGVGEALQVLTATGMNVSVQPGRAIINCKWFNLDSAETVPITAAAAALNRYTAVVIRLNMSSRTIAITTIDGTPATNPVMPQISDTAQIKDLCLAMIYVAAGATSLTQANITDMRASTSCGWVTGLIKQVDTSQLFLQWQTAYEDYYTRMTAAFDEWFSNLTQQLNVNTFIKAFRQHTVMDGTQTRVLLSIQGYTYDESDIINVFINGLYGHLGTDYTIDQINGSTYITPAATGEGTVIDVVIYRSQIGFYLVAANDTDGVGTENNEGITA